MASGMEYWSEMTMMTARRLFRIGLLGLWAAAIAVGCRGDEPGDQKQDQATAGAADRAPEPPAKAPARERPRVQPPVGAVRPPADFNRPPPGPLPRYQIELDRDGHRLTYEVQPDGTRKRLGQ